MAKKLIKSDLTSINDVISERINIETSKIPNIKMAQENFRKESMRKLAKVMSEVTKEFDIDNECWETPKSNILKKSYRTILLNKKNVVDKISAKSEYVSSQIESLRKGGTFNKSITPKKTSKSSTDSTEKLDTHAIIKIVYDNEFTQILNTSFHLPKSYKFVISYTISSNIIDISGAITNNNSSVVNQKFEIDPFNDDMSLKEDSVIANEINDILLKEFYIVYFFEKVNISENTKPKTSKIGTKGDKSKKESQPFNDTLYTLGNDFVEYSDDMPIDLD